MRHCIFSQDEILDASKEELFSKVAQVLNEEALRSNVFNPLAESSVPRYELTDLYIGRILGRGSFGVVNEVKGFRGRRGTLSARRGQRLSRVVVTNKLTTSPPVIPEKEDCCSIDGTATTTGTGVSTWRNRDDLAMYSLSSTRSLSATAEGDDRLVIKRVAKEYITDSKITFLKGTIDLATEAKYLSSLCHPHIMKVRGTSKCAPTEEGFFVLLDRLYETLAERLTKWMHADLNNKGPTGLILGGGAKRQKNLLCERVMVSCSIADALDYLHDKRIIYRDLKPTNIGFDAHGVLKVFDFGLAKELNWAEHIGDDLYRMTGFTGALRYMAPEVAKRQPYNLKADSYSWAMLMWYILALEPPFGLFTASMMMKEVFEDHVRPPIFYNWPKGISDLIERCWQVDIHSRADFSEITETLREEVANIDPSWLTKRPIPTQRGSMNLIRRFSNRF